MIVPIPKNTIPHSCPSVEDFRPLRIPTTHYKILTKVLAKGLEREIGHVVGDREAYGLRGRSIQTNLLMMREMCEDVIQEDSALALLQVDLTKPLIECPIYIPLRFAGPLQYWGAAQQVRADLL